MQSKPLISKKSPPLVMIEMKLDRLLLPIAIKKFFTIDEQLLTKFLKTEDIAIKQFAFFELDFFHYCLFQIIPLPVAA